MTARNEATARQIQAAEPERSTWLAANAGSGKTKVLTDRVARLLLNEVAPQNILCLTYTKAAAGEMQNRLFRRLGQWAMMADDALRAQLGDLGIDGTIGAEELRNARTLFARAIEAPGGLKIQTIHSFCASLLRRFPLEAGVSPQFTEIEERAAALLRTDIVQQMSEGEHASLVRALASHLTDQDFESITGSIVRYKSQFHTARDLTETLKAFGLPGGFSNRDLLRLPFDGSEKDLFEQALPILAGQSATAAKTGATLAAVNLDNPAYEDLNALYQAVLYKDKAEAKHASIPGKKATEALGVYGAPFHDFMDRIAATREAELALMAARKTHALNAFASVFVAEYETRKQHHGWLDFDDLIEKTRDLLTDPRVAAWVLYRLDGGISHILVDEAQDTSPVQWSVIERLAQEFTSGEGARASQPRTIFVVGDKKQSIYSFQGADPREFDRMQADFAARLAHTNLPLQSLVLQYSFRSSRIILDLVDKTFEGRETAGFSPDQTHNAFKSALPGRVDLWPVVPPLEKDDDRDWHRPVDLLGQTHHTVVLASAIAHEIKRIVDSGTTLPDEDEGRLFARPVRYGDFLILVQRRSDLFAELIRICKQLDLPIAGADRLKVGAEMAVKDIAALLSFLALPEDDLSLAVALRSPLFGWGEQQIFDLAHKRSQTHLWPALRDRESAFPETLAMLHDLRKNADYLRPYDLIERILTRHDGRRKLLERLGPEAEDGIDALLSQALGYERNSIPSLTGFLLWLETDELEIKRQMGGAGNRIRVMTVHGAKGLESPIVILPDSGKRNVQIRDDLLVQDSNIFWKTAAEVTPQVIRNALDAATDAEEAERDRLLYVAMTRAEKWLIVAAAGELDKGGNSWHEKIHQGMLGLAPAGFDFPTGTGLRLESENWAALEPEILPMPAVSTAQVPAYFSTPAPQPLAIPKTLSPSDLGGAKALPGEAGLSEDEALRRGRQIHRLFEFLPAAPEQEWPQLAHALLSPGVDAAPDVEIPGLLDEVRKTLLCPDLAHLFARDALAEVSLSATLPQLDGRRVHGTVDRLIITADRVLAVDFKTNAIVPATPDTCPDGLLRQMGAYAVALGQIYPKHTIETALLWTRTARLMMLPHDLVVSALNDTPQP